MAIEAPISFSPAQTRSPEISGQIPQTEFMTPDEFTEIMRHAIVVMDSQTSLRGNLMRLADAPLKEGGEPEKMYQISLRPDLDLEQTGIPFLRLLSAMKRDIAAPSESEPRSKDDEVREEESIQRFFLEHRDLLATVPVTPEPAMFSAS